MTKTCLVKIARSQSFLGEFGSILVPNNQPWIMSPHTVEMLWSGNLGHRYMPFLLLDIILREARMVYKTEWQIIDWSNRSI